MRSRKQRCRQQIAAAGLTKSEKSLGVKVREMAVVVGRKPEYDYWYKMYSKLSHATAWVILGGCNWAAMMPLLVEHGNSYAEMCLRQIATKTGLRSDPSTPAF